jgi:hypothetical protein
MTRTILTGGVLAALALGLATEARAAERDYFILRDIDRAPDEAVAALRERTEADDDWLYLAEFGLAGDTVTAVKICYVPIAPHLLAADMHIMAMMPCGHLAFYEEDGQTRLSMLDLDFMTALDPDPNLERAADEGNLAFESLLDEVFGAPEA